MSCTESYVTPALSEPDSVESDMDLTFGQAALELFHRSAAVQVAKTLRYSEV